MPGPLLGVMCSYLCHVSSGPTGQPCSACGDGAPGAGRHTGSVDAGEGREDVSATVVLGVVMQQSPLGSPLKVPSMLVGPPTQYLCLASGALHVPHLSSGHACCVYAHHGGP